jgi:hypothetical protein
MSQNLLDIIDFVPMIDPINIGSARSSDVVSIKNHGCGLLVFYKAAGSASEDPTLTLLQATNITPSNAKALTFTTLYTKQGTLTSVGTWTKVTQAAANTYTNATASENGAVWAVPISAEMLDVDGGFDCIQVTIADAGSVNQIACVFWLAGELRFAKDGGVSAIAN